MDEVFGSQRHVCIVDYRLWRIKTEQRVEEIKENHKVRFFFLPELSLFMECTQFAPLRFGAFPQFDHDPDETTWNILGVARAV
jgi:hypothetical protein